MIKIRLLTIGKIANPHIQALAKMYQERIDHYASLDWEIIKPEKIKTLTPLEILAREGQRIEPRLDLKETTALLDKDGRSFTSEELAAFLESVAFSGKRLSFIIGGPWGIAENIKKKANHLLSLSKMTFPHELAAVILLEQLYRALSLRKGEKYHK